MIEQLESDEEEEESFLTRRSLLLESFEGQPISPETFKPCSR